jgi:hypothetical protein
MMLSSASMNMANAPADVDNPADNMACSAGEKVAPLRRMARTSGASAGATPLSSSSSCSNAIASGTSTSARQPGGPI